MGKIKLLSDEIINQIAAGEIVERPASALKEVVENAIDAGARNISVFLKGGGKEKIVVEDDGTGLSDEDLTMSVKRHATSKLSSDNLFDIMSYGFRGEALPSIASVSNFSIESGGRGIAVKFSEESGVYPSPVQNGTIVTIENLFGKIPARLKFMKSEGAELTRCLNVLENFALVRNDINFTARSDDKTLMSFNGDSTEDRISKIVGSDTFKRAVYISDEGDSISISGYLFHPMDNRHSQGFQRIFVNGRVVSDMTVSISIRNAYKDLIPSGRFAVVVLFITIDPFHIDVNVSPTKSEIRFRDGVGTQKFITSAISKNLMKFDRTAVEIHAPTQREYQIASTPLAARREYFRDGTTGLATMEHVKQPPVIVAREPTNPSIDENEKPNIFGKPIAQLFDSYIVTEVDDGILIIDQHAVHEKITQHKMLESINVENKRFITRAEVLRLSDSEVGIARDLIVHINSCGFVAEVVQQSIIVSAIPQIINITEALEFIRDTIENHDLTDSINILDRMKRRIADIACHNSIRFGRRLSIDEMSAITKQMEETPSIHQCNHHRTSFIKITKTQLEKMFDR
ncbi:MAG: DNA mismatch repair endonuclease MutL [Holosporales bacterium]|jgi:DNA mismatch repair protein MutL|nr:DNA mismatch repair endonuclease MutL [Holosporales bacterium]